MRFEFANRKLELLYTVGKGAQKLPPEVYSAFVIVVEFIDRIQDERALYDHKALYLEKLLGKRKGQFSIRLNNQYRLCFEIIKDKAGNIIWILDLVDYH
jgi:proteic killer suppression protein